MVRKVLMKLNVIQQRRSNATASSKLRLNPYNPLSYLTLILIIVVGLLLFGVIGFWQQIDKRNPFNWQ